MEQVEVTEADEKLAAALMARIKAGIEQVLGSDIEISEIALAEVLAKHRIEATQAKDEEIARLKGALVGAFETIINDFKTSDDPATADAAEVLADEIEAAILGASNG